MKKLQNRDKITIYHEINEAGDHNYFFFDGTERVDLDWGDIGHIPNAGDSFPHPNRDIDLELDDILWADYDP